jgi:hypothetical protein
MVDAQLPRKRQRTLFDAGYFVTTPASSSNGALHQKKRRALPKIEGLSYIPNFVNVQEQVLIIKELDKRPWRTDIQRRTQHYGGYYVYKHKATETQRRLNQQGKSHAAASGKQHEAGKGIKAPQIPSELGFIIDRLIQHGIYPPDAPPDVLVVNEYVGKQRVSSVISRYVYLPWASK